jgi:tetratricopeptide (TPR) repeat protein
MDLIQFLSRQKYQVIKPYIIACATVSLTACASTAPIAATEPTVVEPKVEPVAIKAELPEVEPLPLNAELVYYVLTAEIAGQRGEIGVATELYNNAATSIDSPALASRSTEVANFTRDKSRINRALNRWLEVDPDNAEVYVMQAPFLIMQNDFDGLTASINKSIRLAPDKKAIILAQVADALSELADAEFGLKTLKYTEVYLQQDPEALFIYARLAAHYKQYQQALTDINKVLALDTDREDGLILKAQLLQRLNKGNEALKVLKKPASQPSVSDDMLFAYAKLLGENGKTDQAREAFQKLNAKLPNNQEILFALGLLALEEKDGKAAKTYFSQLISMGDQGKQASYFMVCIRTH